MAVQVLTTRIRPPPLRARTVARERLFRRLDEGAQRTLTVVAAPAGYGKTTLVRAWTARRSGAIAWLSLDHDDGEPRRFLLYLVAALRAAGIGVREGLDSALASSRPPSPEAALAEAIEAVDAYGDPVVLVLDDLHELSGASDAGSLTFLVENAPGNLRIVCTTRVQPDLPLARMRARGELMEIGPAELAFATDEVEAFLADVMRLGVPEGLAQRLNERTDGWVAGLQLAALSLERADDPAAFVAELGGDQRHIFDYLTQEVLAQQPSEVWAFLLETSVLARMSAPLCAAVTGHPAAAERLEALERENLFVLPLDERRAWYRYHPLFADALQAVLDREHPGAAAVAHGRASAWFEAQGSLDEAVHHAFEAGDMARTARLVEIAWRPMDRTFRTGPWLAWAEALPHEEVRRRPVVEVGMAWARLSAGDMERAARDVEAVEARLGGQAQGGVLVDDDVAFRTLPARIAGAKAFLAQSEGRGEDAERLARAAMALAPEEDPGSRGIPAGLLGLAAWNRGDLPEAAEALRASAAAFHAMDDLAAALSTTFGIAEALLADGRLAEAERELQAAFVHADARGGASFPGKAELWIASAEVALERGAYEAAEASLRAGEALGGAGVLTGDEGRLPAAIAYVALGLGNVDAALERLDEAERNWIVTPVPDARPIAALRARAWLTAGLLEPAKAWQERSAGDLPASYVHAYELLTRVRVDLATFRWEDDGSALARATQGLEHLLHGGGDQIGARAAMEAWTLLALARDASGDKDGALEAIGEALALATPGGYQHVFLREGMAVAGPLRAALREGVAKRHVRDLLDALRARDAVVAAPGSDVEPLTDRESEVLRLLAGSMTGPQIARQLAMSVHTLRSHTKSIYAKLGVHSRKAAVALAAELESG